MILLGIGLLLLAVGTIFVEANPLFSALLPLSIFPIVGGVILGRPDR